MSGPRSTYLPLLGHEMHVTEWGAPDRPAVVLWHGLARTGRDFDELAARLSERWFVLCPDTIGRGLSSWSTDPDTEYTPAFYARMALAMLDHYGIARCAWLGTSMGGLIGMHLAGGADAARVTSLVVNDIGPELPAPAVARIIAYATELPHFAGIREGEAWFRKAYVPFGPAEDSFWQRMAETSLRRCDDGSLTLHYDPRITAMLDDVEANRVWDVWDRIALPTHVLRGAQSDLLTEEIAQEMTRRGPKPQITVFEGFGHAPSLVRAEDAALVEHLLIAPC